MERINTRRITLCAVVIALGLLTACDQSGTTSQDDDDQKLGTSVPSAIHASNLPDNSLLSAFLEINGDRHSMTINGGTAEATIPNLPPGASTVAIGFDYQSSDFGDVTLATAAQTLNLQPGQNLLTFDQQDYQFPDDDGDGATNLTEIENNTDPRDAADRPRQWGVAGPIETDDTGDAHSPRLAVDPSGNALAVWHQSDGAVVNVWANRFDPAGGWRTAELIEFDNTNNALLPQIAMDANGNGLAIWIHVDDGVRANRFDPASGWGTPVPLGLPASIGVGPPRVAMNASGVAVAVWHQRDDPLEQKQSIWANRFDLVTGWGDATVIDTADIEHATEPEIAVDVNGNALAMWRQADVASGGFGAEGNLWANRYVADTGWGTPTQLELLDGDNKPDFDIAMDSSGNGLAVWIQIVAQLQTVRANRFDAATGMWGAAELIESPSLSMSSPEANRPNAEFDAADNAVAVWEQSDGIRGNIYANRFEPTLGWGDATLVEDMDTTAVISEADTLAFRGSGDALAIWKQTDGTRFNVWSNRFDPTTGWGTAVLVENNNSGDANFQRIGIDESGRGVAVWVQTTGNRTDIWSNRLQ